MTGINEAVVEEATLDIFRTLGYHTIYGPEIGPGGGAEERSNWDEVILTQRLNDAVARINPDLPQDAVNAVVTQVLRAESQNTLSENLRVHQLITQGVPVEYRHADGAIRHGLAWLLDFANPENNEWLALNQFTIIEDGRNRRPDVVIFVNGLLLGLFELKNPGDENATLKGAFNQIQTYRNDIGSLFVANAVCVVSDGLGALMGSFSAGFEHYAPWKTIEGRTWAVNAAIDSTIDASRPGGDRRGGVVWHTQGSGKSLEMLFYAAKAMRNEELANPTIVLITDRNDLDDQLFGEVFAPARILPETPQQANSRAEMRKLLELAASSSQRSRSSPQTRRAMSTRC